MSSLHVPAAVLLLACTQLAGCQNTDSTRAKTPFTQANQATMKVTSQPMLDVERTDKLIGPLADFLVEVKFPTAQPVSPEGISFTVSLHYSGATPLTIYNPLHYLQCRLIDKSGTWLQLRPVPPVSLINTKTPLKATEDFSFALISIEANSQSLNLDETVNQTTIAIQPGMEIHYALRISEYIDPQSGQLESLPKGGYQLGLTLSLIKDEDAVDKSSHDRTLKVDGLEINLY